MSRRTFLKASAMVGAGAFLPLATACATGKGAAGGPAPLAQGKAPTSATSRPIQIRMGGYAPAKNGFSLCLKRIGDQLTARFPKDVEVKYVYNIMDLGYLGKDILWLVEDGVLTLGYQSSSYMSSRVPAVGIADLPFLFPNTEKARAAMDGQFGKVLAARIEERMNYRILGYFENGFRYVSNRVRPVRTPADLKGLKIRVMPSKIQARTFELLGADPKMLDLTEAIQGVKNGTLDAQENPFVNTVTYGVHKFHKYHSMTNHFYLSRPIFLHRQSFDAWPPELQAAMREAVRDTVAYQRGLHEKDEEVAAATIRKEGGEILELTPAQLQPFVSAVAPMYAEARALYDKELLASVGL